MSGNKAEAAAAVPDELVDAVTLMGDEDSIRRQLGEFHAAGVRTLLLNPLAEDDADRVEQVGRLSTLVGALPVPA